MSLNTNQKGMSDRRRLTGSSGRSLHCLCCGQLFERPSGRGPQPYYCSVDCRRQMAVRRRIWMARQAAVMNDGVIKDAAIKDAVIKDAVVKDATASHDGGGAVWVG